MNTKTIGGVSFSAVRHDHPRRPGVFWRAKVDATGEEFEQGYPTRPAMWEALEQTARILKERFAKQCGVG